MNGYGPFFRFFLWIARRKFAKLALRYSLSEHIKPVHILSRLAVRLLCQRHRNRISLRLHLCFLQPFLVAALRQTLQLLEVKVVPVGPTRCVHDQLSLCCHNLLVWLVVYIVENAVAGSGGKDHHACNGKSDGIFECIL